MKVLFLTNIPSPYRVNFFNELGKNCELTVLFERSNARDRNNEWLQKKNEYYRAIVLKGKKIGTDSAISFDVIKYLKTEVYDIIIIGGYSTPTGMIAIAYLKHKHMPYGLSTDGGFVKFSERTAKKKLKKYLISNASYWLSSGDNATNHLLHYGACEKNIYHYPLSSMYAKDILQAPLSLAEKKFYKEKTGIKESKAILSVGQFIFRKGFDVLLQSCSAITGDFGVYIIGGEPTQEYLDLKEKLELENVHFIGFKTKEELEIYYKACDIFVLPTREDIWGLVINEAMAYGLPIITTDKCAAGLELVKDYENGFLVPINDANKLAEKMNCLLSDPDLCARVSANNLDCIREYTIEKMAKRHLGIFGEILASKTDSI